VDFLIVGNGMFGAAIARHLAPHASVTVVGPEAPADGSGAYGARSQGGSGNRLCVCSGNAHLTMGETAGITDSQHRE
jgi:glycine/D-amino acid oxidase-like deaminating enzyme